MGYAISIGSGLLVGIGLLIWALRERKLRYEAQASAAKALVALSAQRQLSKENASKAQNLEAQCTRLSEVISELRKHMHELRTRLAESNNPIAIKDWLDDVLKGGVL